MPDDRRLGSRQILFRIGQITHGDSAPEVDCLVRDTSDTGALIEVRETDGIPNAFSLNIPSIRLKKDCYVVRRTKHMLGVAFAS